MEAEAADAPPGRVEAALSCFSSTKTAHEIPDVYIVERLFSSSLVVVVSHTKPRQMNVYHFKKGTEICNYSYASNILSIRLNRQRLLVCLEESIYIHNIKDMKLLKTLLDIPSNPTGPEGLCAPCPPAALEITSGALTEWGTEVHRTCREGGLSWCQRPRATLTRVSLCDPDCPETHCVDQAVLKLRDLVSASRVLGLKNQGCSEEMQTWPVLQKHPRSRLCALSINHSNSYLAYPGSQSSGEIVLYDGNSLKTVCTIAAHEGTLAAITFNSSGSKLASASEKGTVIRVFSVPEGQKLYEFRRGMKRYVTISSLVFSMDSQFLCASSNTETVHIFKLEHQTDRLCLTVSKSSMAVAAARTLEGSLSMTNFHYQARPEEPSTWSGYMGKMLTAATNYLPAQVSDMMNQDRAFATGRLNFSGQKNICTLSTIQKLPRLLVASSDGHLYIYNLDPQDGGECVLIKTHSLLSSGTTEENKENDLRPSVPPSYAATVARPSTSAASTVPGYSEDGGALRGEVIPEHEFATGPVCLDDENEFPPVSIRNP
ncbi:WD repeat domain phosphoinositide-interacting protein 1 [Apodemus speciosus]|uniref:WD repeat domain phosphoinositide-interacting protein 1 n=1 Tax=Apodemus speciosus TaxID=105296 RepID=A0ABQ0FCL5_APOSI